MATPGAGGLVPHIQVLMTYPVTPTCCNQLIPRVYTALLQYPVIPTCCNQHIPLLYTAPLQYPVTPTCCNQHIPRLTTHPSNTESPLHVVIILYLVSYCTPSIPSHP